MKTARMKVLVEHDITYRINENDYEGKGYTSVEEMAKDDFKGIRQGKLPLDELYDRSLNATVQLMKLDLVEWYDDEAEEFADE